MHAFAKLAVESSRPQLNGPIIKLQLNQPMVKLRQQQQQNQPTIKLQRNNSNNTTTQPVKPTDDKTPSATKPPV